MKIYKNTLDNNRYELILENDKNEVFKICYGGADLYWSMSDYHENNRFNITPEDGTFYSDLENLFKLIQKCDDEYNRLLNGNCFEWLSEAYGLPEYAHKLLIKKEQDSFSIEFIRNPDNFSPINTCYISFCLSGSRNQRIANAFSTMFLQYQNYDIDDINIKVKTK